MESENIRLLRLKVEKNEIRKQRLEKFTNFAKNVSSKR